MKRLQGHKASRLLTIAALAAAVPAWAGGPLASGSTVAGSVSGPTFRETWTFSGTAGDRVLFAAVTTSGLVNTAMRLLLPGGGTGFQTSGDRVDYALPFTGSYTLEVEDSGLNDAGSYALSLLNVTAGPLASGADPDGGALASAAHVAGQMNGPADFDAFTFNGTAGSRVLLSELATGAGAFNGVIHLYPPGGGAEEQSTSTGRLDRLLGATGTYTVVIEDSGLNDAGGYTLSRLDLTDGPWTSGADPDGGPLASGETQVGDSDLRGDFDAFRFSGLAGQRVLIGLLPVSGASYNPKVVLYPPDLGEPILNSAADRHELALPANGFYTLVIEDNGLDHTGSYRLAFVNVTAGPFTSAGDGDGGALVSGGRVTGSFGAMADFDVYEIQGGGGDRLLVAGFAASGASANLVLRLYPPTGGAAEVTTVTGRFDHALAASGTYRLVVEDNGLDDTGNYAVSLLDLTSGPFTNPGDADGGTLVHGASLAASFNPYVDLDGWHFGANAGDQVTVTATATIGGINTAIYLYGPNGGPQLAATTGDVLQHTLAQSGVHTVVVHDNALLGTGTYTLQFAKTGETVSAGDGAAPARLDLGPPRPQPAAGAVSLSFALPAAQAIRLTIHDAEGARVRALAEGRWAAGEHRLSWDGRRDDGAAAPPGMYFVRLEAGPEVRTQRLVRVR